MKIPTNIKEICDILYNNKYEIYIVGGSVRDYYLCNKSSQDYDLVTNAKPDEIYNIFSSLNSYVVKQDIGKSFNITLVNDIEIATFRKDNYFGLDAKNVRVEYADTIIEDLKRRDFTMNSIAYNPINKFFIDPFNGISDIKKEIIRFTGNAKHRIYEDPCRIIRACRFLSLSKNIKLSHETEKALTNLQRYSTNIKPERIKLEIMKAMKYSFPSKFFIMLHKIGILKDIFNQMDKCYNLNHGKYHVEDVFSHLMLCGDFLINETSQLRLVGYLHDVGKYLTQYKNDNNTTFINHENIGAEKLTEELKNLRFSTSEIKYITNLVKFHMRQGWTNSTPKTIRKLLRDFKKKWNFLL